MKTKNPKTFSYHFDSIDSAYDNVDDNNMYVDDDTDSDDMVNNNDMEDNNNMYDNNLDDDNMKNNIDTMMMTWTTMT